MTLTTFLHDYGLLSKGTNDVSLSFYLKTTFPTLYALG